MTRRFVTAIVAIAVSGVSLAFWISSVGEAPNVGKDFFAVPDAYPAEPGQQMRPRWHDSEEALDATTR